VGGEMVEETLAERVGRGRGHVGGGPRTGVRPEAGSEPGRGDLLSLKRPLAVFPAKKSAERPGLEPATREKRAGAGDAGGILRPVGTQATEAKSPSGPERLGPKSAETGVDRPAVEARALEFGAQAKRPVTAVEKDAETLAGEPFLVEPAFLLETVEDRGDRLGGRARAGKPGGEFPPSVLAAGEPGERPGVEPPFAGVPVLRPRLPARLVLRRRPTSPPPPSPRREARAGVRAAPRPGPR